MKRRKKEEPPAFESPDEMQARLGAAIAAAGASTEAEMRDQPAARPKTPEELAEYVRGLVERPHDYGTCVYAMSLAAVAAINFVAGKLGVTGFQASCADMDVIRRTRSLKHGFLILSADELLYPQYDLVGKAADWVTRTRRELRDEAARLLRENKGALPDVVRHWKSMAGEE